MRQKFLLTLSLFVVSSLFFAACGSGDKGGNTKKSDSPTEVVEKAMKTLLNKDYKGMVAYIVDMENATEEEVAELAAFLQLADQLSGGIKEFTVTGETISEDGQSAVVLSDITYNNGDTKKGDKSNLVLTDKGWRLALD